MKRLLICLLFLWNGSDVFGQLNNEFIFNPIRPADSLQNQLRFNLYSFNYVRNYEYSNRFHDGYTLFGTQIEPKLIYYAHPNLSIAAGAYLRKDFGRQGVYDVQPLFSLTYSKRDLTFIFGALEGNIQHRYIEPLFNFEQKINSSVEYGSQLLIDKRKLWINAWIAWQKMIYRGEATKEEIVGGFNVEPLVFEQERWSLRVPVQVLAYHQGGQIDVLKEKPISTLLNGAIGIKLQRIQTGLLKSIVAENYFTIYNDFSPTKVRRFQNGYGFWLNAGAHTTFGSFIASYWKGNGFISIKGMPLFESVSHTLYDEGYIRRKRSVLALRYSYQKTLIPNLYLDLRFEPHVDFHERSKNLQFSHSLFLTYKSNFRLVTAK